MKYDIYVNSRINSLRIGQSIIWTRLGYDTDVGNIWQGILNHHSKYYLICQVGGGFAGRDFIAKQEMKHSWLLLSPMCHDTGNKKKYNLELVRSLNFPSSKFFQRRTSCPFWARVASSIISLTWLVRKPTLSLQIETGCSILYQVL